MANNNKNQGGNNGGKGNEEGKQKRGFAAMPKEKVREIARKGGEASHGGQGGEEGQGEQGRGNEGGGDQGNE